MIKYLIVALLLLSAPAMACDSYEECMKNAQNTMPSNHSIEENGTADMAYLRAIAYKLDEISKSLDGGGRHEVISPRRPSMNVTDLKSCLELANLPVVYKSNIDSCYERYNKVKKSKPKSGIHCPACGSSDVHQGIPFRSRLYKSHLSFQADTQMDSYRTCNKCKTEFIVTTKWNTQKETK